MRHQRNPLSRRTQNPFCDDGRLPLVEGAGGEPAAEEPGAKRHWFDFDSASMTEITQVASTLDPRIRAAMNARGLRRRASYRITLPFKASKRKRFLRGLAGEDMNGTFGPHGRME